MLGGLTDVIAVQGFFSDSSLEARKAWVTRAQERIGGLNARLVPLLVRQLFLSLATDTQSFRLPTYRLLSATTLATPAANSAPRLVDPTLVLQIYITTLRRSIENPTPDNVGALLDTVGDIARFLPPGEKTLRTIEYEFTRMLGKIRILPSDPRLITFKESMITASINDYEETRMRQREQLRIFLQSLQLPEARKQVPTNYDNTTVQRSNILAYRLRNLNCSEEDIATHFGYDLGLVRRHIISLADNYYLRMGKSGRERPAPQQLSYIKDNLEDFISDGWTTVEIATTFNIDPNSLRLVQARLGLRGSGRQRKDIAPPLSYLQKRKVLTLATWALPYDAIAELASCTSVQVTKLVSEARRANRDGFPKSRQIETETPGKIAKIRQIIRSLIGGIPDNEIIGMFAEDTISSTEVQSYIDAWRTTEEVQ